MLRGKRTVARGFAGAIAAAALAISLIPVSAAAAPLPFEVDEPESIEDPAADRSEEPGADLADEADSEPVDEPGSEKGDAPPPMEEEPGDEVSPPDPPAETPVDASVPDTVTIEGTLIVVPVEFAPVVDTGGGAPAPQITHEGSVSLLTENDDVIPFLEGDPGEYATGQEASVTFAVPEAVQVEVAEQIADHAALKTAESAPVVELVVETAAELEQELAPISHEVELPVAAAQAARAHFVDVIYLEKAGVAPPAASEMQALVTRLSEYWRSESGGQISGISATALRVETMPANQCGSGTGVWSWAASRFGKNLGSYVNSQDRHLIVLEPTRACESMLGTGLGTVGLNVHSGGLIRATVNPSAPASWNGVVFHEFGHNLSLGHANSLECVAGKYDTPGFDSLGRPTDSACQVNEYGDLIDVMGMGYTRQVGSASVSNMTNVAALSSVHRIKLGALPQSSIQRVTATAGSTQTITLKPLTDSTGIRVVEITVPGTAQKYLLEYRAGTGRDATSLYNRWRAVTGNADFGPGVRVLRAPVAADSAVLHRPKRSGEVSTLEKLPYLSSGSSFTSSGGSFTVTVMSLNSTSATVQVKSVSATTPGTARIWGQDRYATAVAVSKHAYPGSVGGTVIVATGLDYPDSLSAAPLGAKLNAPLLLTDSRTLPSTTRGEIARLKPSRILIVGGTGAVSSSVETQLRALAPTQRIWGANRYATSEAIVRWGWNSSSGAFIATGENFADALSAGAAAGSVGAPVILVPGSARNSPAAASLLNSLGAQQLYVAGGTGAVSTAMSNSLKGQRILTRFAGSDRFDTSARIAQQFRTVGGSVYLANGFGFADALTGAVVAGGRSAPLMLSMPNCVPAPVKNAQVNIQPASTYLLGGTGVLSEAVRVGTRC